MDDETPIHSNGVSKVFMVELGYQAVLLIISDCTAQQHGEYHAE